mgnify:FL=1
MNHYRHYNPSDRFDQNVVLLADGNIVTEQAGVGNSLHLRPGDEYEGVKVVSAATYYPWIGCGSSRFLKEWRQDGEDYWSNLILDIFRTHREGDMSQYESQNLRPVAEILGRGKAFGEATRRYNDVEAFRIVYADMI